MAQFKNQNVTEARLSWRISNVAEDDTVTVDLFDIIGDPYSGVTGADFVKALREVQDVSKIILNISSPGGYVSDALLIYNALLQHPAQVEAHVVEASSAASFVAMAADEILIVQTGKFVIHDAHGICMGDASDMRTLAALMDEESDNIASIYATRRGGSVEEWRTAMKANDGIGTSYRGQEAVDAKLADGVMPEKKRMAAVAAVAAVALAEPEEPEEFDLSSLKQSARLQPPAPTLESLLGKHSLKEAVKAGAASGGGKS